MKKMIDCPLTKEDIKNISGYLIALTLLLSNSESIERVKKMNQKLTEWLENA